MSDSNNEEVKEFIQKVPANISEETTDEEETETPPSSSDGEKEPEVADAETDSSKEEPVDEVTPVAEEPETKVEPKPVEGETPREKALRMEATRLKGLLREQRKEELFVKQPESKPKDEDMAGYDPEEVKRFEKLVDKLGYAKKDEIVSQNSKERLNDTFNEFMEAHPEYAPENDKDGLLWNQYKAEFAIYTPTKDPKILRKILNKVHNEIYGVQPAKNLNKINASQEKIKVASHTGASAGKETRRTSQPPSGLRTDMMKGFSDKEIQELLG